MFESFFGMKERPFAAVPRADRYFPAASSENARRTLERCIERSEGGAIVIGPPGSGKSLLCQVLARRFQHSFSVVHLQNGRFRNCKALLQAVLFELRLTYRDMEEGELRLALQEYLRSVDRCPQGMLLLVDEAHFLSVAQLEELHMLTNLAENGQPRVRLVLVGGAALEEKLTNPKLDSLSQRIGARCYLEPFTPDETKAYVRAQLSAVQGPPNLIATEALDSLQQATDGVPRLVNQVCDHALVLAFAGGRRRIDAPIIEEAWADLQQLPSPWTNGRQAAEGEEPAPTIIEFGRLDDVPLTHAKAGTEVAVERPSIHAWYGDAESTEPAEALAAIEQHLHTLEEEYQPMAPAAAAAPLTTVAATDDHPFAERFAEEEVVIDRLTTLADVRFRPRQMVTTAISRELSLLLTPALRDAEPRSEPATHADVAADTGNTTLELPSLSSAPLPAPADPVMPEEPDLIVIEDNPEEPRPDVHPLVKRQDYRQLFAKLRRG